MAVQALNIVPRKACETVQTTQYTANNARAIIDVFTVTNNGSSNQTFSVNLPAQGDTPSNGNRVIASRTIAPLETYECPELVGQILNSGGYISTIASSTDLTISASGREITG